MDASHRAFAIVVSILFLKMFVVAGVQGVTRFRTGKFVRPEDAVFFKGATPGSAEDPLTERAQNTLRNDVENIPIFLALAWAAAELAPSGRLPWYMGAFALSRIVHTAAYLRPTQPLRNRAYLVGITCCLALTVELLRAAMQ